MNENLLEQIVALETAALEKWLKGNPDAFLELSDADIVYFDPFFEKKIEGFENLKKYYQGIRGMIYADGFEIIDPVINHLGNIVVLCYNFNSYTEQETEKWNCTEVYRKNEQDDWKIIHTHWSFVKPLG